MATLTGLMSRLTSASSSLLVPASVTELAVREASKKAGSSTRNKCRNTPGKRRGIKIYDGQRIPQG